MHFVYDFDSTLFKTSALWNAWRTLLYGFEKEDEEILQTAQEAIKEGFSPYGHGAKLNLEGKAFDKAVKAFQKMIKDTAPSLVFDDVLAFLEEQSGDHKQSILTFGDFDFQHAKIEATQILDYIDNVRIARPEQVKTAHLREMVEESSQQIVFIDDNPRELASVHEAGLPVTLIRMVRDGEHHADEDHEGDDDLWTCVASLEEIKEQI